MKVALLGATGYVGGRLVPCLLDADHQVRCLARTPERLDLLPWRERVEVVRADAQDQRSLEAGLEGSEAVYYLVHAMGDAPDWSDADRRSAENLQRAAAARGVDRIVYLGGLGEDDAEGLSAHLSSRHEVGLLLAGGPVPVTELRAAIIIGSGSASFEMLRSLVEVLPAMLAPVWVTRTRCQPIAIDDVLVYLHRVLDEPASVGQVLEIGGPEVVTYRQMMDRYAEVAGLRRRLIVPVPLVTPRLSSHWLNLVTPLPIGLARPLVSSLTTDVVVHPERDIRRLIPHEPVPIDQALAAAIRRVSDSDLATSWMDSAGRAPAEPLPQDPRWSGGTVYQDVRRMEGRASASQVFRTVSGLGGRRGWYVTPWLWRLRGRADKLVGGVGMRRGRRHPDDLRAGDALDFFRVETYRPPELLRLRAEMRVPGRAWLEWQVSPTDDGARLCQHARFHPRGVAGRLYWLAMLPFHGVIFGRLARRLMAAAEGAPPPDRPAPPGSVATGPARDDPAPRASDRAANGELVAGEVAGSDTAEGAARG
jgi:uncharacterized protein YbjT (DUF2867 family)